MKSPIFLASPAPLRSARGIPGLARIVGALHMSSFLDCLQLFCFDRARVRRRQTVCHFFDVLLGNIGGNF
jgi:hypothetical protein